MPPPSCTAWPGWDAQLNGLFSCLRPGSIRCLRFFKTRLYIKTTFQHVSTYMYMTVCGFVCRVHWYTLLAFIIFAHLEECNMNKQLNISMTFYVLPRRVWFDCFVTCAVFFLPYYLVSVTCALVNVHGYSMTMFTWDFYTNKCGFQPLSAVELHCVHTLIVWVTFGRLCYFAILHPGRIH